MIITLNLPYPEDLCQNLHALFCWWDGFKMGLSKSDREHYIVADHGIGAARELRIRIWEEIKKSKEPGQPIRRLYQDGYNKVAAQIKEVATATAPKSKRGRPRKAKSTKK